MHVLIMSNILELFKPQEPEDKADCLQCLSTAAAVMTLGGLYLGSGMVFRGVPPSRATPPIYRQLVRLTGLPVGLFGLWRSKEAYELWVKREGESEPTR